MMSFHLLLVAVPADQDGARADPVRVLADCADQGEPGTVVQDSYRGRLGGELRWSAAVGIFCGAGRVPLPPSLFAQNLDDIGLRGGPKLYGFAQSLENKGIVLPYARKIFKTGWLLILAQRTMPGWMAGRVDLALLLLYLAVSRGRHFPQGLKPRFLVSNDGGPEAPPLQSRFQLSFPLTVVFRLSVKALDWRA